jgi:hypothetical protein
MGDTQIQTTSVRTTPPLIGCHVLKSDYSKADFCPGSLFLSDIDPVYVLLLFPRRDYVSTGKYICLSILAHATVLTGAGVSVDSNPKSYRRKDGRSTNPDFKCTHHPHRQLVAMS